MQHHFYGDPRFTRDIDIVLESAHGGHFNIIDRDSGLRADIYLAGSDPLHAWAFERRRRVPLEGWAIWVAPIEYVVLRKLQYYRDSGSDRHLRDVAMMLQISGDAVDWQLLTIWLDRLDLHTAMAAARRHPD